MYVYMFMFIFVMILICICGKQKKIILKIFISTALISTEIFILTVLSPETVVVNLNNAARMRVIYKGTQIWFM